MVLFILPVLISSCSLGAEDPLVPEPEDEEETTIVESYEEKEVEEEKPEILAAEFLSGKFVSETEIEFYFSFPVTILSLSFDPPLETGPAENGSEVKVILDEIPEPGLRFSASIEAEDEWENLITAQITLFAQNNKVPNLQINELRTEYSKPRAEFIELKILSDGNLGAIRVFAAGNNAAPLIYQFPPVEVSEGEYVVLHLRTLEEGLCVDEIGEDLAESGGTDSCPSARDFWIPQSVKLLRKTDAVYVMDQDDNVLDAVMISETPDAAWGKEYLASAASFLFAKGAWKSPSGTMCQPVDAVDSSGIKTSATRSISRDEELENSKTAADWHITEIGGATPGLPNK